MQARRLSYGVLRGEDTEVHSASGRNLVLGAFLVRRLWGTLPGLQSLRRPLNIKQLRESLTRSKGIEVSNALVPVIFVYRNGVSLVKKTIRKDGKVQIVSGLNEVSIRDMLGNFTFTSR